MADEQRPEPVFDLEFPMWFIVDRPEWLAKGMPWGLALVGIPGDGQMPILISDEHQAMEFLEDAQQPRWATIIVRDARELLATIRKLSLGVITNVGLDLRHPASTRNRRGWVVPLQHIYDILTAQ